MGYTTEFYGKFTFDSPVTKEFRDYINNFSASRRMKRDVKKIKEIYPDWASYCFNGNLGIDGEYFVSPVDTMFGDDTVIELNYPPDTQPGLWCEWIITDDCKYLVWSGGEKFYYYTTWLKYLIDNFIAPSGYVLNGNVEWQGEDCRDIGEIIINNNIISVCK